MLPTSPLSTLLFLIYTLDILYIHRSFPFAMRTTKAADSKKKDVQTQHKFRDSPPRRKGGGQCYGDLRARMLNWSHETGRTLLRPVDRVIARKVTRLHETGPLTSFAIVCEQIQSSNLAI